jgi:hypothetical protein
LHQLVGNKAHEPLPCGCRTPGFFNDGWQLQRVR